MFRWTSFQAEHGTGIVPEDYNDKDLLQWVQDQRVDYWKMKAGKPSFLDEHGFGMLTRRGFEWGCPRPINNDVNEVKSKKPKAGHKTKPKNFDHSTEDSPGSRGDAGSSKEGKPPSKLAFVAVTVPPKLSKNSVSNENNSVSSPSSNGGIVLPSMVSPKMPHSQTASATQSSSSLNKDQERQAPPNVSPNPPEPHATKSENCPTKSPSDSKPAGSRGCAEAKGKSAGPIPRAKTVRPTKVGVLPRETTLEVETFPPETEGKPAEKRSRSLDKKMSTERPPRKKRVRLSSGYHVSDKDVASLAKEGNKNGELHTGEEEARSDEWKDRFDKIWQKFGGSCAGEQKLAAKLEKKYGSLVRLTIVRHETAEKDRRQQQQQLAAKSTAMQQKEEAYYEESARQRNSGILSFVDANFDASAALVAATSLTGNNKVMAANTPWLAQCSLLDRVDQCRSFLPPSDPLYKRVATATRTPSRSLSNAAAAATTAVTKLKAPPAFIAMATLYKDGPLSVLYHAVMERKRVRVLVRYVDGIRGTLTGHLLAFDKHYNMLLRNVDEVYTPRYYDSVSAQDGESSSSSLLLSRTEREVERRLRGYNNNKHATTTAGGQGWTCRQRHLGQILVRGDNVVLVYRPDQEQSCWPVTKKSPTGGTTRYRKVTVRRNVPPHERVGTPGSLNLFVRSPSSSSRQQPLQTRHNVSKRP